MANVWKMKGNNVQEWKREWCISKRLWKLLEDKWLKIFSMTEIDRDTQLELKWVSEWERVNKWSQRIDISPEMRWAPYWLSSSVCRTMLCFKMVLCNYVKMGNKIVNIKGSRCGSVGRVVASDTRDPWFEFNHWQILCTINCIVKMKIKERGPFWRLSKKLVEGRHTYSSKTFIFGLLI